MESSVLIILTGKNTRHSSFFSARFWGSISTILPHSLSPPQPRKATIRPYPLSWTIVYSPIPPCLISNKYLFLPSFVNVYRSCRTACRRSVTCYPTPVSHSCAMLCNANMFLPPDFFGPPYQEKRDTGAYFRFVYFLCAFL